MLAPPGAITDRWSRRMAEPIRAVPRAGWRVRARARQAGAELPLVISDHADWDELTADHPRGRRRRDLGHPWPRGGAGALRDQGSASRPRRSRCSATKTRRRAMKRFAAPRSTSSFYQPQRNAQAAAAHQLFRHRPRSRSRLCAGGDDRRSDFQHAKAGVLRDLAAEPAPIPRCSRSPTTMSAIWRRPSR